MFSVVSYTHNPVSADYVILSCASMLKSRIQHGKTCLILNIPMIHAACHKVKHSKSVYKTFSDSVNFPDIAFCFTLVNFIFKALFIMRCRTAFNEMAL